MANPRIDDLRRRIEREPGSRLFAQLAEELRKDGDLAEAIRVARAGLAAHPNYPSARLTLGRALFDTGQFGPARVELEGVLRGAPDNILAARMLAECLEGLGDAGAALLQYRAALRLSPGDKQIEAQARSIEQRLAAAGGARAATPQAPATGLLAQAGERPAAAPHVMRAVPASPAAPPPRPPVAVTAPEPRPGRPPAPSRLPGPSGPASDDFDDVFEPAPSWKRPAVAPAAAMDDAILLLEDEAPTLPGSPFARPAHPGQPPAPVPVAAPVTLVFEAPPVIPVYTPSPPEAVHAHPDLAADTLAGAPAFGVPPPPDPAPPPRAPAALAPLAASSGDAIPAADGASTAAFSAYHAPTTEGAVLSEAAASAPAWPPPVPPEPEPPRPLEPSPLEQGQAVPVDVIEVGPGAPLSTPTLAELYLDQGFFAKAVEVYEQILEREPQNERVRARLIEVKALARTLDAPPLEDPRVAQKRALARKIARLEQMLAAVRRG